MGLARRDSVGRMTALWLTHVDPARRAVVMSAVKVALMSAGVDAATAMSEAEKACRIVAAGRGPAGLVIDGNDLPPGTAQEAHDRLLAALKARGQEDAAKVSLHEFEAPSEEQVAAEAIKAQDEARGITTPALDAPAKGTVEWIEQEFAAPPPEGFEPTAAERKAALMVMQLTNGNPQVAWFTTKQFCRNTEQYEFWVNVNHVLTETFVWPTQYQ